MGYLLLTDPGTGKSMVVSLWGDEVAVRAGEQQAVRGRDGIARPTNGDVTGVDRFEVAIADLEP